jgi:serine/threonine-protein kinase LATS1/2
VINWQSYLHIPIEAQLSDPAADLILQLCTSFERRIGVEQIKEHPFFGPDFDLGCGLRKQSAPYVPCIRYPTDTSNFDPVESERLSSEDLLAAPGAQMAHNYENNDYMNMNMDQNDQFGLRNNATGMTAGATGAVAKSNPASFGQAASKVPEHAFFEFTFRRFFDDGGNAYPIHIDLDGTLNLSNFNTLQLSSQSTSHTDPTNETSNNETVSSSAAKNDEENGAQQSSDKNGSEPTTPVYV